MMVILQWKYNYHFITSNGKIIKLVSENSTLYSLITKLT